MKTTTPRDPVAHAQQNNAMKEFELFHPQETMTSKATMVLVALVSACALMALIVDTLDQALK